MLPLHHVTGQSGHSGHFGHSGHSGQSGQSGHSGHSGQLVPDWSTGQLVPVTIGTS